MRTILAIAMLATTPAIAAQPAFNCDYATKNTELLLCTNESLAMLDQINSRIWYEVKAVLPIGALPRYNAEGRAWIKDRNSCGWDVGCVEGTYYRHIYQMCSMAGWSTPTCADREREEH
jgi:uncharacterized protein